jgi:tetratricopeptide (TPR) repeat protein
VLRRHPRDANAHFWYGGMMSAQARHSEAVVHMQQAARLSRPSLLHETHVSWALYHAGDHRKAYEHLRDVFGRAPGDFTALYLGGRILAELGEYDEASDSLMSVADSPLAIAAVGYVNARARRRAEAECALDRLRDESHLHYVSSLRLAVLLAALGHMDDARAMYQLAHEEKAYSLIWSRVDPQIASLQ